jgi:hypothetical protein
MLGFSWSVRFGMELVEEPVQNMEKLAGKRRSQSERVGRLKYMLEVLKRIEGRLGSVERRLNRIEQCWASSMTFDRGYIEDAVCNDEVDREILRLLFEAGNPGMLPKDVATKLERFKTRRFQVSRRLLRMNKRLTEKIGRCVAEQRGWHWALTSFCYESWGKSVREVEEEVNAE